MKSLMTTLLVLSGTIAAQAATHVQSEYFYQAESDNNVLTPEVTYNSDSIKMKAQNKTETTGENLNLTYERGLTEMYSAGVMVGYTTNTSETKGSNDTDTNGLSDVQFFGKGRYSFMEGSSFHYGAYLFLSPSDQEIEVKTSKTEYDANSGGNSLRPYVGYQWLLGSHVLGTRLSTDFLIGKRSVKTKTTSTTTNKYEGGEATQLSVFYEIPYEMGAVGFEAFYTGINQQKKDGVEQHDGYNTMGLSVYSPYHFSDSATVIGNLTWSQRATASIAGTDVDSSSTLAVSVSGRFMF